MKVPLVYRICFSVIVLLGMASGTALGLSIFGVGLDPMNALFCVLVTGVLTATVFVAGRNTA